MVHSDDRAPAQSLKGPLFRRIGVPSKLTNVVSLNSVAVQNTIASREDIEGQTNDQSEIQKQPQDIGKSKYIIAVDFGTTYSTVSYARVDEGVDAASLGVADIYCIDNYATAAGGSDSRSNARIDSVPTEILYLGPINSDLSAHDSESDSDSMFETSMLRGPSPGSHQDSPTSCRRGRKRHRKGSTKKGRKKARSTWTRSPGASIKWGFSVQNMQKYHQELQSYQSSEIVKLIKLSLGHEAEHLAQKRRELAEQVQRLQSRNFVRDRDHILQDYLTRLLHHARNILKRDAGLEEGSELEFVLCVPVSWSESACRIMHDAMATAIHNCRLHHLAENVISDLFIVSEPEAAAQFVIASLGRNGRLRKDEVFILLDAGGGTVDITTYKVTSDSGGPLRLQGEMVPPDGALCGSSLITDRYAARLRIKLQAEGFPVGTNIEAQITALANDWDILDKPGVDIYQKLYQRRNIFFNGTKIKWTREEIDALFEPSLQGTADLFERQLELANKKNLTVSKLIVVGGFGESPSLYGRIQEVIRRKRNLMDAKIETIWPNSFPTSAVARGAVLRALNKQNGPSRILRSSFGFLRHEQYNTYKEHVEAGVIPTKDKVDHFPSVNDTIQWVIEAGMELPTRFETEAIKSCHYFPPDETELICIEYLYSSPGNHRSHFQKHHPENEGAYELSHIEVDVSEFRKEFEKLDKPDAGPRTRISNRKVREVKFDLVIMIEGRQLKYEARWPPDAPSPAEVRLRKQGYISLAPSFVPGTE